MRLLGLKTFRHGIHPPESKDETRDLPIRQFPFAPVLVIPLVQHMGKPSLAEVQEGQEVTRGQRIARADGFMSVSMHAPASGRVRRIGLSPSISGQMVPGVFLEPFPGSTQETAEGTPCPLDTASPDEIIFITVNMPTTGEIKEADVVGAAIALKARLRMVPIHTVGIHFHPYDMCRDIAAKSGGVYVDLTK